MMPAPTAYSWARITWPSSTIEALAVVPPMSKVMILPRPAASANACAPMTPPAGPDSMMFMGRSAAAVSVVSPPFDCMSRRRAGMCAASRWRRMAMR